MSTTSVIPPGSEPHRARPMFPCIPWNRLVSAVVLLGIAWFASSCTPRVQAMGPATVEPAVLDGAIVVSDGYRLPTRVWPAVGKESYVIVGLHGFNDYSNAFAMPAEWWAERGVTTYAYDQRGFGDTVDRGIWPGTGNLVSDLFDVIRAVRARHGETPVYLAGASMGGAVILAAYGASGGDSDAPREFSTRRAVHPPPRVDGIVLAAPAVWGRATMNPIYRAVLWFTVRIAPGARVSGKNLGITPSDNVEMLRALGRDPLIIKDTRADAVYGLVNLMDAALEASSRLSVPALVLYGEKDEIIPRGAAGLMAARLDSRHRFALYPNGYHMLFRDLQAEVIWRDVLAWIGDSEASLPSGNLGDGSTVSGTIRVE